jgi:hypothetical protein
MFSWISSWWSTSAISGPARNAPNEGKNIKEIISQKPAEVSILTQEEIIAVKNNLRKTVTREAIDISDDYITFTNTISLKPSPERQKHPLTMIVTQEQVVTIKNGLKKTPTSNSLSNPGAISPIVKALNTVFAQGNAKYFEDIRIRRETAKNTVSKPEPPTPVTNNELPNDEISNKEVSSQEVFFEGTKMECRSEITCEELTPQSSESDKQDEVKQNFTQDDIAAEVHEFSDV